MAKYIGTYADENAIVSAVTNQELSRPFVALANDTKQVYYGKNLYLAQIGDIVVYDHARMSLRFIHLENYNTTTYPTAIYEPIGVIIENQTATITGDVNRNVRVLSKNWMDKANPDSGNTNRVGIEWGDNTVATNATSATDGKANTTLVLTFATGQTDWQTASAITFTGYDERMYPAFECAWRYHTNGTNQGDWYIGANDELNEIVSDETKGLLVNSALTVIGVSEYYKTGQIMSSKEERYDLNSCYNYTYNEWRTINKVNGNLMASRALYKGTILPI